MVLALSLVAPAAGRAQISPGPLARPHERLEGSLQCVKCHVGGAGRGKEQMTARCSGCHKEIAWLVERSRGLHGRVREQRCAECHPDHAGKDFAPVAQLYRGGSFLIANNSFAGNSLADLVLAARRKPNSINYASYGPGSTLHQPMT